MLNEVILYIWLFDLCWHLTPLLMSHLLLFFTDCICWLFCIVSPLSLLLTAFSHCPSLCNDLSHPVQCNEEHCWSVSDTCWSAWTHCCLKDEEHSKGVWIAREEMSSELSSDDEMMFHCSVSSFSCWGLYADLNDLAPGFLCLTELWQQSHCDLRQDNPLLQRRGDSVTALRVHCSKEEGEEKAAEENWHCQQLSAEAVLSVAAQHLWAANHLQHQLHSEFCWCQSQDHSEESLKQDFHSLTERVCELQAEDSAEQISDSEYDLSDEDHVKK